MVRRLWALVALFVLIFLVDACGGGGGGTTTVPTVTDDAVTIMDAAKQLSNGTVIETEIYYAIDDIVNLHDGTTIHLVSGEAKNFVARAWAWLLQPDGTYRREEVTMVPGMRFSWCLKGLDEGNAGLTIDLVPTLAQITVAASDLPPGGRYDLSVRAEIAPADLVGYVNGRLAAARAQSISAGGSGGSDDDLLWAGAGFLLALAICPSDSAGVILTTDEEVTPPPPPTNHPPILHPTGPTALWVGQQGGWDPNATDEDGDALTYRWVVEGFPTTPTYSHSFAVQGTYSIPIEVSDGHVTVHYTWTVVVSQQSDENLLPNAVLIAQPFSGVEPLSVTLDASVSDDPDGTIVKYEWDVNGDGTYETYSGANQPTLDVEYVAGTWTPRVRVTDNDGATDTATGNTITVTTGQPPTDIYANAVVSITPQNPSLNIATRDQQQFWARIYAEDGITELDFPPEANVRWSSDTPELIDQFGYLDSTDKNEGQTRIYCTVEWDDGEGIRRLTGSTTVHLVNIN